MIKYIALIMVVFGAISICAPSSPEAATMEAIDSLVVGMPRTLVLSIMGPPAETGLLVSRYHAEIYHPDGLEPMIGLGCIYGDDDRLAGLAYVFAGIRGQETAERMRQLGFILRETSHGSFLFTGEDDDTGLPLVVTISETDETTTVITFEEKYYSR